MAGVLVMTTSVTLEPEFKSRENVLMRTDDLTIGAVAEQLGIATSALRYYERRGLVTADSRTSGQRRYLPATVRRLVFIQMLQDGGLTLDEIQVVLTAGDNAVWKELARQRLEHLDAEIARLTRARELLGLALLCRFDHPLDECQVMNDEIDRRLGP